MKVLAQFAKAAKVLENHLLKADTAAANSGRKMLAILARYVQLFRIMVHLCVLLIAPTLSVHGRTRSLASTASPAWARFRKGSPSCNDVCCG